MTKSLALDHFMRTYDASGRTHVGKKVVHGNSSCAAFLVSAWFVRLSEELLLGEAGGNRVIVLLHSSRVSPLDRPGGHRFFGPSRQVMLLS
jgi:hypothetical protein